MSADADAATNESQLLRAMAQPLVRTFIVLLLFMITLKRAGVSYVYGNK